MERIRQTLAEGEKANLSLDYLFCCNGDQDIAYEEHKYIMEHAVPLCPQLVPGKNYDYFKTPKGYDFIHTIPGGIHDMNAWQLHLYHALQIFFR